MKNSFTEKLMRFLGLSPHAPDYGPQYQLWREKPRPTETVAQALQKKIGHKKKFGAKKATLKKVYVAFNETKPPEPAILESPPQSETTPEAAPSNTEPTVV